MAYAATRKKVDSNPAFTATKIAAIAWNTFRESIRQPVVLIILLIAVLMIAISPYTTFFTLMEQQKMVKEMGLATMFVAGLLIAAFASSSVISREIENKTVLSVLAKPVGRIEFIVGKYLGVVGTLLVTGYVMTLVLLLTGAVGGFEAGAMQTVHLPVLLSLAGAGAVSMAIAAVRNFRNNVPFAASAVLFSVPVFTLAAIFVSLASVFLRGAQWEEGFALDPSVFMACVLVGFASCVLGAIAVAVSTRLQTVMTVVICALMFLLGLLSDYLFLQHAATSNLARFAYAVTPNLQALWMGEALANGMPIPLLYVIQAGAYALCYTLGILCIAMFLFEDKQVS